MKIIIQLYASTLKILGITGWDLRKYFVDSGKNVSIECSGNENENVVWFKEDLNKTQILTNVINGSLILNQVNKDSSGIYSCMSDQNKRTMSTKIEVIVRSEYLKYC